MEENNIKTYTMENGEKVTLEEISTFRIEELGKDFLAYTINDDGISKEVTVRFVELLNVSSGNPTIKPVDDAESQTVINTFNSMIDEAQNM